MVVAACEACGREMLGASPWHWYEHECRGLLSTVDGQSQTEIPHMREFGERCIGDGLSLPAGTG